MIGFAPMQGQTRRRCVDFLGFAQNWIAFGEASTATPLKVVKPNNFTTMFDREAESGFCSDYAR